MRYKLGFLLKYPLIVKTVNIKYLLKSVDFIVRRFFNVFQEMIFLHNSYKL